MTKEQFNELFPKEPYIGSLIVYTSKSEPGIHSLYRFSNGWANNGSTNKWEWAYLSGSFMRSSIDIIDVFQPDHNVTFPE